jgi:G3E family GTPase
MIKGRVMKIKVDILLGFLGSGKTTLINSFLESGELNDETIVIVQYESGKVKVQHDKYISATGCSF